MPSQAGTRDNFSGNVPMAAPTGGTVPGGVYIVGQTVVVAQDTQASGSNFNAVVQGAVWASKATTSGKTFAQGAKWYADPTNFIAQPNSTGMTIAAGVVLQAAVQTDTTVLVYLAGDVPATTA